MRLVSKVDKSDKKKVGLGGHRQLVIDVALDHEFRGQPHGGCHLQRGATVDPAKLLEATAHSKIV